MSKIEVNQISSQCGSTLTIGQSGDTVTLACGATQTGFGRTGTVDWCTTAKTAPFTGVSGKGYFVNTTCGAVTVTLPATPSAGDIISIKDYARTAGTNNINFCRNGSKMDGTCGNGLISTNGDSTTLIYVDGTKGWTSILDSTTNNYGTLYITATGGTVLTCGDYKTHIFTADGCFAVSCAGNPLGSDTFDYVVIAGGASGGIGRAGGGGAGGFRLSNSYSIPAPTMSPLANPTGLTAAVQTYPVTVGAGGAGKTVPDSPTVGNSGTNSIFSTITSAGGGAGGGGPGGGPAVSGGSGGGGAFNCGSGAAGNTPPTSPPQGSSGGNGNTGSEPSPIRGGGGGGGAGGAGTNTPPSGPRGPGGIGSYISDTFFGPTAPSYGTPGPVASTRYFSGGGGAGGEGGPSPTSTGGFGGGTDGVTNAFNSASATANTGGGSGGIGESTPYSAGSWWIWYSNDKI
jgi:hypothetical protein